MELAGDTAAPATTTGADMTDYPALFRTLLLRSVDNALAAVDLQAPRLGDEDRERSLYTLGLALDLAAAWPGARDLLLAIAPHMEMQGYRHEWIDFLKKGLVQSAATGDLQGKTRAHLHLARLYQEMGEYGAADVELDEAETLASASGDLSLLAVILDRVQIGALDRGDLVHARTCAERVLAMLPPEDPACAPSLHTLGVIAEHHGTWETTFDYFHRALDLRLRQGVPRFIAQLYRDLGVAHMRVGDFEAAHQSYNSAILLFGQAGDEREAAHSRMLMGNAFWFEGKYAEAFACYSACEATFVKTHDNRNLAMLYNNLGLTQREFGRYDDAAHLFAISIEASRALGDHHETANVLDSLAVMYRKMGKPEKAIETWECALQELAQMAERPRYLHNLIEQRMRETSAEASTPRGDQVPDLPA